MVQVQSGEEVAGEKGTPCEALPGLYAITGVEDFHAGEGEGRLHQLLALAANM